MKKANVRMKIKSVLEMCLRREKEGENGMAELGGLDCIRTILK